ncbi:nitroreductase [Aquimarina sp. EL_43]|uniref:nitroreductase family protein n=1 Tax=unclassified Aquimarina TaxID=2627091 RepID=UPI0018CAF370|nr:MULTISPECIES: nitroreductase [unclassified Aquimarina]MBG6131447.1 nitroreductase [Aquimarina sp. EL_35]MBG6151670.1 nitroreductase [Aquimarina sp. EL_32]MBG6169600.1 nitroreductase [Aquimarina sp. EL_43]
MFKADINEIIRRRRSVFPAQYNEKIISKELIKMLLENANWAPTHKLTQPWRFKVVEGEAKDRLGAFLSDTYTDITSDEDFSPFKYNKIINNCKSASAIVAICMQRDLKERVPEWEEVASTAMAVQNMWLTCTANDIGCYWSSPKLINYMDDFFDFEEGERCLGFFYLGYYDEDEKNTSKREPIESKVQWME